jgi:chaperone protein EcpD
MLQRILHVVASLALLMTAGHAPAAISLSGTRLIYDAGKQGATIVVRNASGDILVQSWIEGPDPEDAGNVPFAVTPPLANLQGNKQQLLRVLYSGGANLPTDRESVFYLNVQEIPQSAEGDNVLQIAIRQRIKIFFRPTQLSGEPEAAPVELQWKVAPDEAGKPALQVSNPSAYHVSIAELNLAGAGKSEKLSDGFMVAPGEKTVFPLKELAAGNVSELRFQAINDYGGNEEFVARTGPNFAFTPTEKAPRPTTASQKPTP